MDVEEQEADIEAVDLHLCHGKVLVWNAQGLSYLYGLQVQSTSHAKMRVV